MDALTYEWLGPLVLALALGSAVLFDLRTRRIPNALCVLAMSIGLSLQWLVAGVDGLAAGGAGVLAGFAILLPFYLLGGMGAGDVKLMAAVGAFLGLADTVVAASVALVTGGIIAVGLASWMQATHWLRARVQRRSGAIAVTHGAWTAEFPYAAAIAIGAFAAKLPADLLRHAFE